MAGNRRLHKQGGVVEIFDLETALAAVEGDRELLAELLIMFSEQEKILLQEIDSSITNMDGEKLRTSAHSLKGALGNLGASQGAQTAHELEKMGETGDFDSARKKFEAIIGEIDSFKKATENLRTVESR